MANRCGNIKQNILIKLQRILPLLTTNNRPVVTAKYLQL